MEAIVYFPIFFPPSFYIVSKDVQSNTYWKEPTYPLTASYETLFMCCPSWVTDRYKSHRDFIWISGLDGQEGCAWLVALTPGDSRGGKFCKELASGLGSNWFFFLPLHTALFHADRPPSLRGFLVRKDKYSSGRPVLGWRWKKPSWSLQTPLAEPACAMSCPGEPSHTHWGPQPSSSTRAACLMGCS